MRTGLRRNVFHGVCLIGSMILLSGCFGRDDRAVTLASSTPTPASPSGASPKAGRPLRLRAEPGDVVASTTALPNPDQIFDFHPRGARTDEWRQPFIIAADDGPLTKYVQQTAKELREFKEADNRPGQTPVVPPTSQRLRALPCDKTDAQGVPCPATPASGSAQLR